MSCHAALGPAGPGRRTQLTRERVSTVLGILRHYHGPDE